MDCSRFPLSCGDTYERDKHIIVKGKESELFVNKRISTDVDYG